MRSGWCYNCAVERNDLEDYDGVLICGLCRKPQRERDPVALAQWVVMVIVAFAVGFLWGYWQACSHIKEVGW